MAELVKLTASLLTPTIRSEIASMNRMPRMNDVNIINKPSGNISIKGPLLQRPLFQVYHLFG
jgi:hypothetical protein